jgi:hypothetical protein
LKGYDYSVPRFLNQCGDPHQSTSLYLSEDREPTFHQTG